MCHYFRVSKIFVLQRVNSRFFVEFFVVSQCRKFPLGNPLVFYLFRVSKKIMDNRGGGDEEEGSIRIFRRKFVSQPRKIS